MIALIAVIGYDMSVHAGLLIWFFFGIAGSALGLLASPRRQLRRGSAPTSPHSVPQWHQS